ncbi:MAG: VWA domain-containing protein [Thermodesulfobacteriota bacterium]
MGILESIGRFFTGHFLSPGYFWFFAVLPLVVLLYLLKLRRTEIVIASTMLWTRSLQDLTANAPFQRLRRNLLLFLQILILLLVIIALARPFMTHEGPTGNNLCLIIDRSASMKTVEGGTTRVELAKKEALDMVDTMAGSDKAMVVAFGAKTDVLSEFTDDKERLRKAIAGIKAVDTGTNLRDVMLIARSLAPDNRELPAAVTDLKLILLSDGKVSDLEELGVLGIGVDYVKIGHTSHNAGITVFNVRTPEEGQGPKQAFVLVHNESERALATTVTIYLDDRPLGSCEIKAEPGSDGEAVLELPEVQSGVLRAELDHPDALAADNVAWLVMRPRTRLRVLLVATDGSSGAYFLQRALSLDPRVDLARANPTNYSPMSRYDLTVFESWSPKQLPGGCLVFINTVPPESGVSSEGKIENPPVLAVDSGHILTRLLNPAAVRINEAMALTLPAGARTLVSTRGGPLIADISRPDQTIAVVAFDIAMSNWPLNLSFPLFVQNLVAWTPDPAPAGEASISTGQPLTIMPSPDVDHADVTLPDGTDRRVEMEPTRPVFFAETETAGVYRVQRGNETVLHAVNLLDKNESSITPAPLLKIGRGEVVGESGKVRQNVEYQRWLLLFALIVLALEWWIYSRRARI